MKTFIDPTARVSKAAKIGAGCRIGAFTMIGPGVKLGAGSWVGSFCHLGYPAMNTALRTLAIGAKANIRSHTVLYLGSTIGAGLTTGHHAVIREKSRIGARFQLGSYGDVQGELVIGDDVRTQSHVYICQYSEIEDFVWLFPGVLLANDPHPPSDGCTRGPRLKRFCAIGMGAVVADRVVVGEGAVVGACALVRADVPAGEVHAGVPAKRIGLAADVRCRHGALKQVYPWRAHFKRGYPALPE